MMLKKRVEMTFYYIKAELCSSFPSVLNLQFFLDCLMDIPKLKWGEKPHSDWFILFPT